MKAQSLATSLPVLFIFMAISVVASSEASAWRSSLYPEDWSSPESRSFETDKLIQDFSYAGYRRSEVELPRVTGPVFDVVADFGADATGASDSTRAIQDAIDAASAAGGGVVFLPAGTYRVRPAENAPASLRVRASNVVIRGAGPESTFLFNDAWQMRNKDIIRVDSPGSGWTTVPQNSPLTSIRTDLLGPTAAIPVESVEGFTPGDWVVLRADASEPFKAEHNMEDLWGGQNLGAGVFFVRQILAIDEASNLLRVDVPIRYYLKTRDGARVHRLGPHIDEVGLEDFSLGNIEHPNHGASTGWGLNDYSVEGTNAYDVHGSYAIRLTQVRNSWVRNVRTYRPPQNSLNAHVLSNGMRIGNSVAVTIEDCHFQRALYAGGGGNAYMVRITNAQEVLVKDTVVGYNRHGFVFSHMQTSGNVILRGRAEHTGWRAIAGGAGSSGSDHHMHLSQSNLIDGTQLRRDYFAAYYRHTYGSNHGQTAAHTVYWNLEGLEYYGNTTHIVNTQQARYGYVIGTRGSAPGVSTAGVSAFSAQAYRTNPVDHVEGQGMGESLEPRSLFDDQLRRRLGESDPVDRVAMPEISPHGGTYFAPQMVGLRSETPGAVIHYTLNGETPTTSSPLYVEPIELERSGGLRAVAFAEGRLASRMAVADFRFTDDPCLSVTDSWQSTPIPLQMGAFEFEFHASPQSGMMNSVMGLADGSPVRYQDLAAIVRFSPEGVIDARDGGAFAADAEMTYESGATYHFRLVVDLQGGTYDVFVRPEGAGEVALARGFGFRTEQASIAQLNRFGSFAAVGENRICDFLIPADVEAEEPEMPGEDVDHPGADAGGSDLAPREDVGSLADVGVDGGRDVADGGVVPDGGEATVTSSGCACSITSQGPGDVLVLVALGGVWGLRRRWRERAR